MNAFLLSLMELYFCIENDNLRLGENLVFEIDIFDVKLKVEIYIYIYKIKIIEQIFLEDFYGITMGKGTFSCS